MSDLERERLTKRETLDRHTRNTNDVRVKSKLSAWLKNTSDAMVILKNLPKDQSRKAITDDYIFQLLDIIDFLLEIAQFAPVEGNIEHPDEWKAGKRQATDQDIWRAYRLHNPLQLLSSFYAKRPYTNPIDKTQLLMMMKADPRYKERLTEAELRGLARIEHALKSFNVEFQEYQDEPKSEN